MKNQLQDIHKNQALPSEIRAYIHLKMNFPRMVQTADSHNPIIDLTPSTRIGIDESKFNSIYTTQRRSQWCWAACIEMVLKNFGLNVKQEDFVEKIYGLDCTTNQLPNRSAQSPNDVTRNLNGKFITKNSKTYHIQSHTTKGALDTNSLIKNLKKEHPIIMFFLTPQGGRHVAIITGIDIIDQPCGNKVLRNIHYRDPFPLPSGDINGKSVMSAKEFQKHTHFSITIDIA